MSLLHCVVLGLAVAGSVTAQGYTISTYAGGGLPVNIPGTSAILQGGVVGRVAVDHAGNVFFITGGVVLRLDARTGILTLAAGNATPGFSGDNGPATSAQLSGPLDIAIDSADNLYIFDAGNRRIRKVSGGVITTVAGNGTLGFSGDNGPATSAQLGYSGGLAVDSAGNLYIADSFNNRIRKVSSGLITTVAEVEGLYSLAVYSTGDLYVTRLSCFIFTDDETYCDFDQHVYKVSDGFITLVAGGGASLGEDVPATNAQLDSPTSLAVDSAGNLYIAEGLACRIRKVSGGVMTTVAGNGTCGFSGDNGPATSAQLNFLSAVAVDSAGNLYIAGNNRIRKVTDGMIATVSGGGTWLGDDGPATSAQLRSPGGIAVDSAGNLYIADTGNGRIRKVSDGVITTVAGGGSSFGDNGPATGAQLNSPWGVAVDAAGNLYIADTGNGRIRKVSDGVITTVAGGGSSFGDNGPATDAQLNYPWGVAVDSAGNLYIADAANHRIRKVSGGVIATEAGNGTRGFSGDSGPATSAQLNSPSGVAVDSAGNLYIADNGNSRIRKVSDGVIANATTGAFLSLPYGVAVDSAGNLYIANTYAANILKVSGGVTIRVAGAGSTLGDNGPATSVRLGNPRAVGVDSAGNIYLADGDLVRILRPQIFP